MPEQLRDGLSVNECMAARYLHADGYSTQEIGRVLGAQDITVANHIRRDCDCPDDPEPVSYGTISGDELRKRRLAVGATQRDLAEKVGVTTGTVSKWERKDTRPRNDKAYAIEQALRELSESGDRT